MIQDLSFPRNDPHTESINKTLDSDDFPTEWGTFDDTSKMVLSLPTGCTAATFDISAAYRITPIRPVQQNALCVSWQNKIYVDRAVMFGLASSAGVFGAVADMLVAIYKAAGFHMIQKWVDDFFVIRYPDQTWTEEDFINLTADLGVPWSASKTKPLASRQKYIGFIWDLDKKAVALPPEKISALISVIDHWLKRTSKVSMKEAASLHGKLVHASSIVRIIRPFMRSISRFAASFRSPRACLHPPVGVRADLRWIHQAFTLIPSERKLHQTEPEDIGWWGDASTSFGIGILVGSQWAVWKWSDSVQIGPRKRFDIGWAEAVAVELGFRMALRIHGTHWQNVQVGRVLVRSDNAGVVAVVNKGRSRSANTNQILQQIFDLQLSSGVEIRAAYVPSAENLADCLSRGDLGGLHKQMRIAQKPLFIPLPHHLRPHLQQWHGH